MSWYVRGYVRRIAPHAGEPPSFERIVMQLKDVGRAVSAASESGCDEFLIVRRGKRDSRDARVAIGDEAERPCECHA
jgi:hypothetical protein